MPDDGVSARDFGRLEGKVDALADEMKLLRSDATALLAQSIKPAEHEFAMEQARWTHMLRGNMKYIASLSISVAGSLVYLAVQWMNWLHTKLGGSGFLPPH